MAEYRDEVSPYIIGIVIICSVALICINLAGKLRTRMRIRAISLAGRMRIRAISLAGIDYMSGEEFEDYVAHLLKKRGYEVQMTPVSNDFGVDIIASKARRKCAIQVKRYSSPVNRRAVSDAVTGKQYYGCDEAMVVTNSWFTEGAIKLASSTGCQLVDREALVTWIRQFRGSKNAAQQASFGCVEWLLLLLIIALASAAAVALAILVY